MPYINVDEVYILDNTGLQVDQVVDLPYTDAGLSDTQQAQARKNIAAGGTNPNLLDNPFFGSGEVVNQRGVTSGTTTNATYFIDRWLTTYGSAAGTYSLGSNGITLTPASSTTVTMYQKLANANAIDGKVVTASVLLSDGTIYSGTITRANGSVQNYYYANGIRIRQVADNGFHIDVSLNGGVTIRAAKLELGSVSTLANDVPPDYGTELLKCQRYFVRLKSSNSYCPFGTALGASTNSAYIFVPLPATLRANPTSVSASAIAQFSLYGEGGDYALSSSISARGITPNGVTLAGTATGVVTQGTYSFICKDTTSYIDLSADL